MMKRFLIALALVIVPFVAHAQSRLVCPAGGSCSEDRVGPFLKGISSICYNTGDCTITDAMITVTNVGNFALGIVGALVLLMYVISGMRWIGASYFPGGYDENIKKGKQGITVATTGLLIVFLAFAAIQTLSAVLRGNTDLGGAGGDATNVVACTGGNDGEVCGLNMQCAAGACVTLCEISIPANSCVDVTDPTVQNSFETSGCQTGMCPGSADVRCCTPKR